MTKFNVTKFTFSTYDNDTSSSEYKKCLFIVQNEILQVIFRNSCIFFKMRLSHGAAFKQPFIKHIYNKRQLLTLNFTDDLLACGGGVWAGDSVHFRCVHLPVYVTSGVLEACTLVAVQTRRYKTGI